MLDCSRWFSRIFNMSEPLVAQIISIVTWTCFCSLNHSDFPTPENIRRSEYAENWYNWRLSTRNWASTRTGWNCTWEIWWVWYKRPSCVNSGWNILHECLEHDKYFGSCRCIKDAYQIDIVILLYSTALYCIWYDTIHIYIYTYSTCVWIILHARECSNWFCFLDLECDPEVEAWPPGTETGELGLTSALGAAQHEQTECRGNGSTSRDLLKRYSLISLFYRFWISHEVKWNHVKSFSSQIFEDEDEDDAVLDPKLTSWGHVS